MHGFTRLFPLWALLSATLAWFLPAPFTAMNSVIVPLLTVIMLGMGMTLTLGSFRTVVSKPWKIIVGTGMQFLIMPLAAFVIASIFSLERELLIGLVLVGCCPGGTASNVVCYLARGDVALSISLTMVSTLVSVLLTPFLTLLYIGQAINVPVGSMMLSILQIVIAPVVLGVAVNTLCGKRLERVAMLFPALSVLAIALIIGIVVGLNRDNLALVGLPVLFAVILHNSVGIAGAYSLGKLLHYDETTCRTLAVEVGMQNSGLAVALATQFFSAVAAIPGALFSLWHNLSGSLLAGWWSRGGDET